MSANEHQEFERQWWGNCANTYGEETKQLTYAELMGMKPDTSVTTGHFPVYRVSGKILDIGGGPVSMLLKSVGFTDAWVVDPCPYPAWVTDRYALHGVTLLRQGGEQLTHGLEVDEVWIYNVLQHVVDPEQVIAAARPCTKRIRIFDWLDTPPHLGHPHTLREDDLNRWLGGKGKIANLNGWNGCYGRAYYGVFDV